MQRVVAIQRPFGTTSALATLGRPDALVVWFGLRLGEPVQDDDYFGMALGRSRGLVAYRDRLICDLVSYYGGWKG